MARNQSMPATTPDPVNDDTPIERFSRELAQRFPDLMIKRFVMPPSVRAVREVFIRELLGKDEIEAALMADALMSDIERRSMKLSMEAERRESIRIAIVGIGRGATGAVEYEHTNTGGVPFAAPNKWNLGVWACLHNYFAETNGVPSSEIAEGIKGAQTVGAFAPPTSATRASADHGRSDGSSGTNI